MKDESVEGRGVRRKKRKSDERKGRTRKGWLLHAFASLPLLSFTKNVKIPAKCDSHPNPIGIIKGFFFNRIETATTTIR